MRVRSVHGFGSSGQCRWVARHGRRLKTSGSWTSMGRFHMIVLPMVWTWKPIFFSAAPSRMRRPSKMKAGLFICW